MSRHEARTRRVTYVFVCLCASAQFLFSRVAGKGIIVGRRSVSDTHIHSLLCSRRMMSSSVRKTVSVLRRGGLCA